MRAESDIPGAPAEPKRGGKRLRIAAVVIVAGLFILMLSLRGIAGFYTDYLWFETLGHEQVFWRILSAKIALALIFIGVFFVIMLVNLYIADRVAPTFRPPGPEEDVLSKYHEFIGRRTGLTRVLISSLFAVSAGIGASGQWRSWLLFRNGGDFGISDPQFDTDVGFYIFKLPFLSFVTNWLFTALVIVFIITVAAHYVNGGIRIQTPGERVTPQVKAHLSVLLGLLALVKAADYYLDRFRLTLSTNGTVDGATFTDVNARLPVLNLLILISLLAFMLLIVNIRRRGWVLPALAVGLWAFVSIVMGNIYPLVIQRLQVDPAESTKEQVYIERNIEATRLAMGLDSVEVEQFAYDEELVADDLISNADILDNVRLLDPAILAETYTVLQAERDFYQFTDILDVDRYEIDGDMTQVVLAARELNPDNLPQTSWEASTLSFTHGFGAALAPANEVNSTGRPNFVLRGVPPENEMGADFEQPRLYYGENLDGYAIVNTDREEVDYIDSASGDRVPYTYEGEGGVALDSFVDKAAFALRFWRIDPLISDFITEESRVIYIRDVVERVEMLAPFLEYDADPYPVIADGRIHYVVDAYTTSNQYPYSQRADNEQLPPNSGLRGDFNYVRNSVKAVIDGYDGEVDFYVMEPDDPIINAYASAFPDLFQDFSEMPEQIRDHIRYPEDLFRVQTNTWARYKISQPEQFYEQAGGWAVAQDPGGVTGVQATQTTTESGDLGPRRERRIDPYYQLMRLPGEQDEDFVLTRTFVPVSTEDDRKELTAFMVAKSDADEYGELVVYEMPGTAVDGPAIVASNILTQEEISKDISLLNDQGSLVRLGELLIVPIENSIVYVRAMYVEGTAGTAVPELKNVIVAFGDRVVMCSGFKESLIAVFGDAPADLPDSGVDQRCVGDVNLSVQGPPPTIIEVPEEAEETDDTDPSATPTPEATPLPEGDVEAVLAEVARLFQEAEEALADGDLGTYQDLINEAQELIDETLDPPAGEEA
jgi:uncharacterized membrane protein (UPF0182 family)